MAAAGHSAAAAGADAPIDSAHQEDRGDDDDVVDADTKSSEAAAVKRSDGAVGESHQQRGQNEEESAPDREQQEAAPGNAASATVPSGLPRIRTAAASATSAILGVARAVGDAMSTASREARTAELGSSGDEANREADAAGE